MLNQKVVSEIDALQKQINHAIEEGDKEQAASLADKLASFAKQEDIHCFVVNITPQTWYFDRSYGRVTVYGAGDEVNPLHKPGEKYAVTEIESRQDTMDVLRGLKTVKFPPRLHFRVDPMAEAQVVNGIVVPQPSVLIARDVVQNINDNLPFAMDCKKRFKAEATGGVFISETKVPAHTEVQAMFDKLEKYYRALVALGNEEYRQSFTRKRPLEIWDIQRTACAYLGIQTEWFNLPERANVCPGCGQSIPPGIAVHTVCGAVIDRGKAIELHMLPAEENKSRKQREA